MSAIIPCAQCGCGFRPRTATRRYCSKQCSGLAQAAARRASGEPLNRFWASIDRGSDSECWPWNAATSEGYGQIRFCGEKVGAHVLSFRLAHGAVPVGKMVLHRCGNRLCCNPAHLYAGTHSENTTDAIRHGTYKTVFVEGAAHPNWKGGARARA